LYLEDTARTLFKRLSSGHAVVLLSITRLVEQVEEKSLVLIDEPESHLHPPLLSAFIRALSDLLINRNGVAIIATHSPVVLQEVPRSCAWKLSRAGHEARVDRPEHETFGENVGTLTREVFGLEVTQTGFHRLIAERAIDQTYEQVLEEFGGQLGGEARALARALSLILPGTVAPPEDAE
jgi:predicted ATP-dependent endonuclease of OLD family